MAFNKTGIEKNFISRKRERYSDIETLQKFENHKVSKSLTGQPAKSFTRAKAMSKKLKTNQVFPSVFQQKGPNQAAPLIQIDTKMTGHDERLDVSCLHFDWSF